MQPRRHAVVDDRERGGASCRSRRRGAQLNENLHLRSRAQRCATMSFGPCAAPGGPDGMRRRTGMAGERLVATRSTCLSPRRPRRARCSPRRSRACRRLHVLVAEALDVLAFSGRCRRCVARADDRRSAAARQVVGLDEAAPLSSRSCRYLRYAALGVDLENAGVVKMSPKCAGLRTSCPDAGSLDRASSRGRSRRRACRRSLRWRATADTRRAAPPCRETACARENARAHCRARARARPDLRVEHDRGRVQVRHLDGDDREAVLQPIEVAGKGQASPRV